MSLQSPTRKMDKSDGKARNYIALLDPPDVVRSKIKRARTDSGTSVAYGRSRPAVSNLITIYVALTGEPFDVVVQRYNGKGYARLKADLAEVVVEVLRPIQARYGELREAKSEMDRILAEGARAALARSRVTMEDVYRKLGFITLPK